MPTAPKVILYSTTLHAWEVWSQSRPLGHGSLARCQEAFPDVEPVSDHQRLLALADEFLMENPWLKDGAAVLDMCVQVSDEFVALLTEHGIAAETVSGILMGTVPEFPDVPVVVAGHHAVLVRELGREIVYDWTARQFDPKAHVPLVQPLEQWRQTWDEIGSTSSTAKTGAPA